MNAFLPFNPIGMMHQFGMHHQSIPQTLQPSVVQVSPLPCGQFQSIPTILPPHQLRQHQQPSQVQRFPIRKKPHPNHEMNVKSQGLHSKHQDLQTHSQLDQSDGDTVNMQKEQQAQKSKEEVQEQNLSSILKPEYGDHNSQTQEASGLQLDQACQQDAKNRERKIGSAAFALVQLPNRLGKMLGPLHWHDYKKKYEGLDEFVASHPELFVIQGDFIHLRAGAHATISATIVVAKVAAAAAAAASPLGIARMPTIAVTPVAQSQVHHFERRHAYESKRCERLFLRCISYGAE